MTKLDPRVGIRMPRMDAPETVAGEAKYTDDYYLPGMLFGAIHASPIAHGKILSIDTSMAEQVGGVKAVITAADFNTVLAGSFIKDEPMFAADKVRYVGEPVAAVAATTVEAAREAATLIDVTYEELPAVLNIDRALAGDAPILHEELAGYFSTFEGKGTGNRLCVGDLDEGDVDAAWADCDVIVEDTFETGAQHHLYLEPSGAVAEPDRQGRVTIWSSLQSISLAQQRVAEWVNIPMAKVRMIAPRIGGGFGGKGNAHFQPAAAALALKTGRPVKLMLTRSEDFEMLRSRHPSRVWMKTGAKADGTLVAREFEVTLDCGAYADDSPGVVSVAVLMGRGPYRIPNVRARGVGVYTNKLKAGAYRGYGNPQISFAAEQQLDVLAARLGMDPVELRTKNALKGGERWLGGQVVPVSSAAECIETVRDAAKAAATLPSSGPDRKRGLGYALFSAPHGLLSTSANVALRSDGSIAVATGAVDIGQGSDTILQQIVADALKLDLDQISFARQDTDSSPYDWKTAASRVTYMAGQACLNAAHEARDKILAHASNLMEVSPGDLELRDGGRVGIVGVPEDVPEKEVTFGMIAGRAHYQTGGPVIGASEIMFETPAVDPAVAKSKGLAFSKVGAYSFGAQAVEVDVDEMTGEVHVLRAWCAHDVGRAINPAMVEGQIVGGFVQGIGYALLEEMVWDPDDGRLANPTLMDYKIPTTREMPEIHPIIIENPAPDGPHGARGIGEPPIVGAPAAIANAIANAIGQRPTVMPMKPERILDLLEGESA